MNALVSLARTVTTAIGAAWHRQPGRDASRDAARSTPGWLEQFSAASLDQRAARRTVDALFRGATVRL